MRVDADPVKQFRKVVTAAGLDPSVISLYAFRHTKITNALLRNLPIRLVAATFDTSVAMIERTYSKFIVHQANDPLRAALVGDAVQRQRHPAAALTDGSARASSRRHCEVCQ